MTAPNPIAFTIFGIDIMWYGILIGTGFILAILLCYSRASKFSIEPDVILDFAIFLIPISIIGARLYYVAFRLDYYIADPIEILNIRNGGLAIHGGIIAGVIVAYLISRKNKIDLLNLADLVLPAVSLAQSIGRWGNFFNSEAHGGPTDLPWAIVVNGQKVHPTFLYESIFCMLLFIFLMLLSKKRTFTGQIAMLYGILYSVERFFVEGLRTDSLMVGSLRTAQVISILAIIICSLGYLYLSKKKRGITK
ncbi:phosphatidylglycerol:prolipoprotein diacylglycerol transferase [Peptostreptococcaceae bacterium pGA-8]|nr:phosphatidylglycerol:prolipoprotein diacylglycerol transferase [Peptostreptococcaceae bacterium pGA-8]